MRSAETSGVEVEGFSAAAGSRHTSPRLVLGLRSISLFSYAIALTALLAATLFVAADIARTTNDLRQRSALLTRLGEAQPLLATQFTAGALDPLIGETDADAAMAAMVQRALLAYGLALILIGLGLRRRLPPVTAASGPLAFPALLSTIPFGVACWTAEGRLLACNEQFRLTLGAGPHEVRPGASYSRTVHRLIQGGYMQLVTESDRSRVLELTRDDSSCLIIDERPLGTGGFVTLISDVTERRRADDLLTSIREEQRILARRYHEEKLRAEAASRSKPRSSRISATTSAPRSTPSSALLN